MKSQHVLSLSCIALLAVLALVAPSAASAGVTLAGGVRVQQDTPGIAYYGMWAQPAAATASGGTRAVSRSAQAAATFAFTGTAFSVVAERGPAWGKMRVYVDGAALGTVDLYAAKASYGAPVFKKSGLAAGKHTVRLVSAGRNPKSTSVAVNIDGFDIVGAQALVFDASRVEESDGRLFWDGPWSTSSSASFSAGAMRAASGSNAEVDLEFTGTTVALTGPRGRAYGAARIWLDGVDQGVVSAYAPVVNSRRLLWAKAGLDDGAHTLTIKVLGTHDRAATSNAFPVDALEIHGTARSGWVRAEDSDARVAFSTGWSRTRGSTMSGGASAYAAGAGAVFHSHFRGSAVRIVATTDKTYGQVEVICDGTSRIVDLYAPSMRVRQRVLTIWSLDATKVHDLEIRVLGTPGAGSGVAASIDAIDVRGSFVDAPAAAAFVPVEEDDAKVALSARWSRASDSSASHRHTITASADGQTARIAFVGTAIRLVAPKTPSSGRMRVWLDGTSTIVDLYSSSKAARRPVYVKAGLANKAHTLTVEVLGSKTAASSGTGVTIDSAQITGAIDDPSRPSGWQRMQQTDARVVRLGVWSYASATSADGGSYAQTRDARASLTVNFTGTEVSWIGARHRTFGVAYVYLDGHKVATVDNYSSLYEPRRVLWRATGLSNTAHTLRIVGRDHLATGSSYWVPLDAIDVVGTPTQALNRYDQSDYHLGYTGTWSTVSSATAYAGSMRVAAKAASVSIAFVGPRVDVYAPVGPSAGIASVSIDGATPVKVDYYRATAARMTRVYSASGLANGAHTVVISWTGAKNAASKSAAIGIDAVDAAGPLSGATPQSRARDIIVRTAIEQLGKPYIWAADGPDSFDCSGLVLYCYKAAGISLPHYSGAQWDLCSPRNLSASQLIPGDLVFSSSPSYIHHVGLYIGDGMTINAPSSGRNVEYRDVDTYGCYGRINSSKWGAL